MALEYTQGMSFERFRYRGLITPAATSGIKSGSEMTHRIVPITDVLLQIITDL